MADGRWVMTENELNNVVSGFKETDIEALPNAGKSMAMRVAARWSIMRYAHFADRTRCVLDLVNTVRALAAARPSASRAEA